jgi:hypothetical protein
MKDRDSQTNAQWSEADVESLLTEFFRAEMPAELRRLPAPSRSAAISPPTNRERRSAGYKGLGAAACALLLAVTALSPAGRNLVSPNTEKLASQPAEQPALAAKAVKTANGMKSAVAALDGAAATHPSGVAALDGAAATHPSGVAARRPVPTLPREILDMLPPELRSPADNAVPVFDGHGDMLDLRELLKIEVFEPRDNSRSRKRRIPERRPRLPEER